MQFAEMGSVKLPKAGLPSFYQVPVYIPVYTVYYSTEYVVNIVQYSVVRYSTDFF